MTTDILFAVWFLLPAAVANAIPIVSAKLPVIEDLDAPIDAGKKLRGNRILGAHKTWRGIISGIIAATFVLWIQQVLAAHFEWTKLFTGGIDYSVLPILLLGPAFAIGALGGDAIESFFKRMKGIKSGKAWIPFDQLDYIIGSVLISMIFVILTPLQYVLIFVIWFCVHLIASYVGFRLGLKDEPI